MSDKKRICILCLHSDDDELKYGEFLSKPRDKISVHYHCLLLSSNLVQRGKDTEGILGFLVQDIKDEAKRIAANKCCYCGKPNASISCCHSKCQKIFHLKCGIEGGCTLRFRETYQSFCDKHYKFGKRARPAKTDLCSICYDELGYFRKHLILRAPCCKNAWFHRWCLARLALNAGYFFKCPLCNNSEKFRYGLSGVGIFIPDRDAAWELEPNAYAELLERPNSCTAEKCLCPHGREYGQGNYKFTFCTLCGSKAQHKKCITTLISRNRQKFTCNECEELIENIHNTENESNINITSNENESDSECEIVDVTCETLVVGDGGNDDNDDDDNGNDDKNESPNENCLVNQETKENEPNNIEDSDHLNITSANSSDNLSNSIDDNSPIRITQRKRKIIIGSETESVSSDEIKPRKILKRNNSIFHSDDSCDSSNLSHFSNLSDHNNCENSLLFTINELNENQEGDEENQDQDHEEDSSLTVEEFNDKKFKDMNENNHLIRRSGRLQKPKKELKWKLRSRAKSDSTINFYEYIKISKNNSRIENATETLTGSQYTQQRILNRSLSEGNQNGDINNARILDEQNCTDRSDCFGDSGIFTSTSTVAEESPIMKKKRKFYVNRQFQDDPCIQTNILKYDFKKEKENLQFTY